MNKTDKKKHKYIPEKFKSIESFTFTTNNDELMVVFHGFEQEMESTMSDIKKFLQKEYKKITGKAVSLKEEGEIDVLVQSTSRVRSFVQAKMHYKVGGLQMDPILAPSEKKEDNVIKEWIGKMKGIIK